MSTDSTNSGGTKDSELYSKSVSELQHTLNNILDSHHEINQRAIDLVKINILSLSVIATGISFSGLDVSLTLLAGFISFLYSVWSCVKVYHPRQFNRGIGKKGGISMDKMISKGVEADEFNRNLLYSYTDAISKARSSFKDEKLDFQRGLLASIVAILFLSLAGIIHLSGNIPIGLEIPMLFVIPILVITIRDNAL